MTSPSPNTVNRTNRGQLVQLPPNRVWRTYSGGKVLDEISGITPAKDSHFPEDWIASTTEAINPGRESIS